ncbi:MAG TPA: lipase maturation factor family protein, partial [Terrimicrobiaceae bacterium]
MTPTDTRVHESYWLTRFVILRLLGALYAVAFLVAVQQLVPLIGENGLTPVNIFVERARAHFGSSFLAFIAMPSLFWLNHSDFILSFGAWTGLILACVVAAGYANALIMAALWILYLSIVHMGQEWYGYGWEIQLTETGFLAIFLCPLLDGRPFPRCKPPLAIIWLFRWLIFRIMLGAGLIKIRGDTVWRDLTALNYHFETQPIPNP